MHAVGYACSRVESDFFGKSGKLMMRLDGESVRTKQLISHCREKPLSSIQVPVPQTDTGR